MIETSQSSTLTRYKNTMIECIKLYYPEAPMSELDKAVEYSIRKRLSDSRANVVNSYKRSRGSDEQGNQVIQDKVTEMTLLQISDYIISREPIVTAFGTMFKHHGEVPNPLFTVVQSFLDNRTKYKKQMFQYPKGSEDFEKYNLLQALAKIDANGKLILNCRLGYERL